MATQDRILTPRPLLRAATRDGVSLPVIDVTDPRFRVPDDPDGLARLFAQAHEEQRRNSRLPKFIMRFLLRRAAKQSLLMRALFGEGDASFLDGITTYVMKLGLDYLPPPFDSPMDRRMASSAHLKLLRLRTQRVAHLLADALTPKLAAAQGSPLALVNIAGGPAIDSMNALILLRQRDPALLRRPIAIHVLDGDEAGPFFGRNALAALTASGAPLAGLDVTFEHRRYDWNDTAALEASLRELAAAGTLVAASTEGGLFEYGSDAAIIANLAALRASNVGVVAGSVTSGSDRRRRLTTPTRIKLIPRGLAGFSPLAERGGWRVARAESAELSQVVLLEPA
jgi:hypothetical protein